MKNTGYYLDNFIISTIFILYMVVKYLFEKVKKRKLLGLHF